MNIYDARSVLPRVKYQIAPYFWTNKLFSSGRGAKTELKLQSQLLKQKHPLPWPECLMLWSAIFYHSNTNVCHNLCQLRDEIINFFSVPCYKKPPEWSMATGAGSWVVTTAVCGPWSPPDISIRAWPDHWQLPGHSDTILQSGHSLTQCTSILYWYSRLPTRWVMLPLRWLRDSENAQESERISSLTETELDWDYALSSF